MVASIIRSTVAVLAVYYGQYLAFLHDDQKIQFLSWMSAFALWRLCFEDYKAAKRQHSENMDYCQFITLPMILNSYAIWFYSINLPITICFLIVGYMNLVYSVYTIHLSRDDAPGKILLGETGQLDIEFTNEKIDEKENTESHTVKTSMV